MDWWRLHHRLPLLFSLLCIVFYSLFAYDLVRTDAVKLVALYSALFFLSFKIIQLERGNFKFLVVLALLFRLLFLFATPMLSQDFYRFIWDGRMVASGWNPYLYLPKDLIENGTAPMAQAQLLFEGMGSLSARHFTNYPPINQLCFSIAGLLSGKSILGSVVIMRLLIFSADLGVLYFGKKLLEKLKLPAHHIFWYILNPFIIIELGGNLHFEGVMLFFLIWGLYLLFNGKWQWAAVVFALSVSVKLVPLIFLPLFFQYFMKKPTLKDVPDTSALRAAQTYLGREAGYKHNITRLIGFYAMVGITTLLLFAPFFSMEFVNNYKETVGLWFSNFEFNGSIYYIAREIGYTFRGRNEIAIIGKYIQPLVVLLVLGIAFLRRNKTEIQLITAMLFALSCYFFVSTTVHPWYIATLVLLSIFTKYRFPLVWSFVIILSYVAYSSDNYKENLWVIGLEYTIVYGYLFWELFFKRGRALKTVS